MKGEPVERLPVEQVRLLVVAGIARGRTERLQRAHDRGDTLLAARIEWWRDGAVGHIPGCLCQTCTARRAAAA
jgi:hypothetical protein